MITVKPNPYSNSKWCEGYDYSIQIPNELSGLEMIPSMDGDQPSYRNKEQIQSRFIVAGLDDFKSVADYPRDGNTLRYMFESECEADLAAAIINSLEGDY